MIITETMPNSHLEHLKGVFLPVKNMYYIKMAHGKLVLVLFIAQCRSVWLSTLVGLSKRIKYFMNNCMFYMPIAYNEQWNFLIWAIFSNQIKFKNSLLLQCGDSLQSTTKHYKALQSTTKYYQVLSSTLKYY